MHRLYRPDAAFPALEELAEKYGAAIRLWRNAWNKSVPFLNYDVEMRKVIRSTNAVEATPSPSENFGRYGDA